MNDRVTVAAVKVAKAPRRKYPKQIELGHFVFPRPHSPRAKSILNATGLRRDVSAQSTFFGDVVGQRLGGRRLNGDPGW